MVGLFLREDIRWVVPERSQPVAEQLSGAAQDVLFVLQQQGAMFASDLQYTTQLLPAQLADALGELIARGWISSDGFAGLRNLFEQEQPGIGSVSYRGHSRVKPRQRVSTGRAGRWALWRPAELPDHPQASQQRLEHWAWQLLRRWGVVFRDLLEREQMAPRWYELTQFYRRLEARGEIRGGRFIRGVAGEQFALSDTVAQLRKLRQTAPDAQELLILRGTDPLNLVGILTPQPRIPSTSANRVVYWQGAAVAAIQKKELRLLKPLTTEECLILAKLLDISPGEMSAARKALPSTATRTASEPQAQIVPPNSTAVEFTVESAEPTPSG